MIRAAIAFLALTYTGPAYQAQEPEVVPMVGREGPEADACVGIGSVFGLNPNGEEFLAVRERPDEYAPKKGELSSSTLIWLCDADGDWQGIVYPTGEDQELSDCEASVPMDEPEPYTGPCESGWIPARNIQLVLG